MKNGNKWLSRLGKTQAGVARGEGREGERKRWGGGGGGGKERGVEGNGEEGRRA